MVACSMLFNSFIDPFAEKEAGHKAVCLGTVARQEAYVQLPNSVRMANESYGSD